MHSGRPPSLTARRKKAKTLISPDCDGARNRRSIDDRHAQHIKVFYPPVVTTIINRPDVRTKRGLVRGSHEVLAWFEKHG